MVTKVGEVLVSMKTLQHSTVFNSCVTAFLRILNKLVFFDNHAKKEKMMILHYECANNLRKKCCERLSQKSFGDFQRAACVRYMRFASVFSQNCESLQIWYRFPFWCVLPMMYTSLKLDPRHSCKEALENQISDS
jgi:hypothetical protein